MNSSGDLFIAFSTDAPVTGDAGRTWITDFIDAELMDPLLESVIHATEEAILNALVAAETMTGVDGNTYFALPHRRVLEQLRAHDRLESAPMAP